MAATKSPLVRLMHIRDELDWVIPRVAAAEFETFVSDIANVRAVERAILIISEAAKSLPGELTDRYPEIEWHAVRGIGNLLRHEYELVDPKVLWRTVTVSMPTLAGAIDRMIAEYSPPEG